MYSLMIYTKPIFTEYSLSHICNLYFIFPQPFFQMHCNGNNLDKKNRLATRLKSLSVYMPKLSSTQQSLATKTNSESHTSPTWPRTQTVTQSSTNMAHGCLTSVARQVLTMVCHNSQKSGDNPPPPPPPKKKKSDRSKQKAPARLTLKR